MPGHDGEDLVKLSTNGIGPNFSNSNQGTLAKGAWLRIKCGIETGGRDHGWKLDPG